MVIKGDTGSFDYSEYGRGTVGDSGEEVGQEGFMGRG